MIQRLLLRGPHQAGDARCVARSGAQAPLPGGPEAPPGGPPEAIIFAICTLIYIRAKTKQQSAFKRLPGLEKACIMPRDVLQKNRADRTYTPEVRSSSGPASLHPGAKIDKKDRNILILYSSFAIVGDR